MIRMAEEEEVKEVSVEEMLEEIRLFFSNTGFVVVTEEDRIPKYIVIEEGNKPGLCGDYRVYSEFFTDGEAIFLSSRKEYSYPRLNNTYYKYRILNASFVIFIYKYGDDYDGEFVWKQSDLVIYGKLQQELDIKLKELADEITIER